MTSTSTHPLPRRRVSRLQAALTHLLGSALVVGCVAALVFGLWYPGPFRILAGGTTLFLILAAVDVVMGPTLTAVVFSPAKARRELVLDLGLILLLQLGALGYGVWTMGRDGVKSCRLPPSFRHPSAESLWTMEDSLVLGSGA